MLLVNVPKFDHKVIILIKKINGEDEENSQNPFTLRISSIAAAALVWYDGQIRRRPGTCTRQSINSQVHEDCFERRCVRQRTYGCVVRHCGEQRSLIVRSNQAKRTYK